MKFRISRVYETLPSHSDCVHIHAGTKVYSRGKVVGQSSNVYHQGMNTEIVANTVYAKCCHMSEMLIE